MINTINAPQLLKDIDDSAYKLLENCQVLNKLAKNSSFGASMLRSLRLDGSAVFGA